MSQFVLLLYENAADVAEWEQLSPEQQQQGIEQYVAWTKRPFVKGSERLASDPGRVITGRGGKPRVMDGPFSESKEMLGGYYVIEARDYDHAVELSMDHPHLGHGVIEIRQVFGT